MERAVAIDPAYAAAHAGIAMACLAWATQGDHPAPELAERARQAARRAIEVGDVAEAHAAIGSVLAMADWDWTNAGREFKRALELNPSFAIARMMYANVWLCPLRRYDEAVREMRQVRALDPVSPLVRTIYGQTLALAGRQAEAVDELRQALELDPNFNFARFTLAFAHLGAGSYAEAIAALQPMQHLAVQVPNCAGHLGYAHACTGNRREAETILQALLDHFQGAWAPWIDIAAIHNGLGHTTQSLDWLELGYRNRCFDALFIRDDPRFVNLRDTPRFKRLAAQLPANAGAPPGLVE
jgi:tetratricopeptide (TPR) repeat protein